MKNDKQIVESVELRAEYLCRPFLTDAPLVWFDDILRNKSNVLRVHRQTEGVFDIFLMDETSNSNPLEGIILMSLISPSLVLLDYNSGLKGPESIRVFVNHKRIAELPTLLELSKS